jgi:glutamate 5-kinase
VARCDGDFDKGDVLRICDVNGTEFARGIAAFDGEEVRAGRLKRVEIVHRDDLVVL